MRKRVSLTLRILLLILFLPLLGVTFAPPSRINAQCAGTTNSSIKVSGGLISAIYTGNFQPLTADVNCVEGQPASIPQFSIQDYDQMKRDYFDQAKSTYNKITITGPAVQSSPSSPINLLSL